MSADIPVNPTKEEVIRNLEFQLAEKEKEIEEIKRDRAQFLQEELSRNGREIGELKKKKSRYASYLCKSDERIEGWRTEITRIAADLGKTRSIFKSRAIAALRERLEKTAEEMKYFARGIANTVPLSDLD